MVRFFAQHHPAPRTLSPETAELLTLQTPLSVDLVFVHVAAILIGAALIAFALIIGEAERFRCGKQIAAYLGLVPEEDSSGESRRLGHISKQGSGILRFFLVEAAQVTVRSDPDWRRKYFHLAQRRGRKIAKVAMARRLAVRLYWMWRNQWDYEQSKKFGPHAGELGTGVGVK
jgi:transposase